MRIKTVALTLAVLIGIVFAVQEQGPFTELEIRITGNLKSVEWNSSSKAFARALWEDYKRAHLDPTGQATTSNLTFGGGVELPDRKIKPDDYIGSYGRGQDAPRCFVKILKSDNGCFFVEVEGHRIPAVARSKSIIFTTGSLETCSFPDLGARPYCTLDLHLIFRSEGQFYHTSPGRPKGKWEALSKIPEPIDGDK